MIKRSEQMGVDVREQMRGGAGEAQLLGLLGSGELPAKCRLFSQITLKPGCGIGYHNHEGETELFYFLQGEAQVDDDGQKVICRAGDVLSTGAGAGHSVHNAGSVDVVMVAVIVLD